MDRDFSIHSCNTNDETGLKVLELYSGIGGMHTAFHASGIPHRIVACMDINTTANAIYHHNFPTCNLLQRNIQSLSVEELESLQPDIITMSPPCQPFTRQGLKKDVHDARTESFLHVVQILSNQKNQVPYILVENVKGFEDSAAHQLLIEGLAECGYVWREFLLTPSQFDFPNSRLRYYLLAKTTPFHFAASATPLCEIPSGWEYPSIETQSLEPYLEKNCCTEEFLLSDNLLTKFAMVLDIVNKHSTHSCCFTKGYGHYVVGTGSVLQDDISVQMDEVYRKVSQMSADDPNRIAELKSLKLRYFSPREIANLMSFPNSFDFPKEITTKQRYRVLGNSVNVRVVARMLNLLLQITFL